MTVEAPDSVPDFRTWIEVVQWRARRQPGRVAYTYLEEGEEEAARLTYAELERQARAIGALLEASATRGERALLLYPPGLEFIAAFLGCLYSGVVAVPVYPPDPSRLGRTLPRLQAIVRDARPSVTLTTSPILPMVEALFSQDPELKVMRCLATDSLAPDVADDWRDPALSADTLALLQYTSGSTGAPKGAMISQGNLLANERMIQRGFRQTEDSVMVGWLPVYHDMGLIGNVLFPLYLGYPCVLMSPLAFLQRPVRWLRAISRYRGTISGAPNFAYDLCVRKTTPEQRATLDLSTWGKAFNGAEPIWADTLERFVAAFGPCGFRREAFYPCYGLAEATLFVSGGLGEGAPRLMTVHRAALDDRRVLEARAGDPGGRTLVGSGQPVPDQMLVIVDPAAFTRCRAGEVGEIWVAGPNVAAGYWNRPGETDQTFRACVADTGEGPFLRTGDLGYVQDGELFITGRLKDLIIVGGHNHYPQDIERTVERSHPALRPGCCTAFSVEEDGEERLVVMSEVDPRHRPDPAAPGALEAPAVVRAIRRAVAEQHDLHVHHVALLKPGGVAKTSSGKLQRHACRAQFLQGTAELWED